MTTILTPVQVQPATNPTYTILIQRLLPDDAGKGVIVHQGQSILLSDLIGFVSDLYQGLDFCQLQMNFQSLIVGSESTNINFDLVSYHLPLRENQIRFRFVGKSLFFSSGIIFGHFLQAVRKALGTSFQQICLTFLVDGSLYVAKV